MLFFLKVTVQLRLAAEELLYDVVSLACWCEPHNAIVCIRLDMNNPGCNTHLRAALGKLQMKYSAWLHTGIADFYREALFAYINQPAFPRRPRWFSKLGMVIAAILTLYQGACLLSSLSPSWEIRFFNSIRSCASCIMFSLKWTYDLSRTGSWWLYIKQRTQYIHVLCLPVI